VTNGLSTSVVAGSPNVFTIQLKDIWGNNVTDSSIPNPITPGEISVSFNSTPILIDVTAPLDGVFQVQYTYTKSGVYWMSVTINNTEVGTSPPGIVVVAPNVVYPPNCIAEGPGLTQAIVGQTNTFTVIVRDVYNNTRMWAAAPPVISLTATGLPAKGGSASNNSDGSYEVDYYIDEKATYAVSVTFNGENINGSPFTVSTNYGNNAPPTYIIILAVLGSVLVVGLLVGAFIWYRRRRTPYVAILE